MKKKKKALCQGIATQKRGWGNCSWLTEKRRTGREKKKKKTGKNSGFWGIVDRKERKK